MTLITESNYRREYGDEYVDMNKETAITIMENFSDYEDKETVVRVIKRTSNPPYIYVPPMAFIEYKRSLQNIE